MSNITLGKQINISASSHARGQEVIAVRITDDWKCIDQNKLVSTVYKTIELLVKGEYDALIDFCNGNTLPVEDMKRELSDWPDTFIIPPSMKIEDLIYTLIELKGSSPQEWAIDANLWTEEEGISDLTLQLILTDSEGEYYDVLIEDLHVL